MGSGRGSTAHSSRHSVSSASYKRHTSAQEGGGGERESAHDSMEWPSISSCFPSEMHKTKPIPYQYMGAPRDCSTPVPNVKYPWGNSAIEGNDTDQSQAKMHPRLVIGGATPIPHPLWLTSLKRGRGILLTSTGLLSAMLTNLASRIATAHET